MYNSTHLSTSTYGWFWYGSANQRGRKSTQCDCYGMTAQFHLVFFFLWNLSPNYFLWITANFSPPQMKVTVTGRIISVQLRPPRTPLRGQRGSWIRVTKLQKLKFRIHLMHNDVEEVRKPFLINVQIEGVHIYIYSITSSSLCEIIDINYHMVKSGVVQITWVSVH